MATVVETPFGEFDIDTGAAEEVNRGVAIFNPAIKGTDTGGNPVIVLALVGTAFLVIDADGYMKFETVSKVRADWRYDIGKEQWVDTNGLSLEEPS